MAEYIEKEKALAFQNELEPLLCRSAATGEVFSATKDANLVAYLQSIPAADVRPVVRGRNTGNARIFECSECGYGIEDIFLSNEEDYSAHPNFCPNCGATMETRARWIPNVPPRDLRPRCSACGELNPTEENYCPNCGADMRPEPPEEE